MIIHRREFGLLVVSSMVLTACFGQRKSAHAHDVTLVLIDMDTKKPIPAARITLAPKKIFSENEINTQKNEGTTKDECTINTSLTGLSDERGEVHIKNVNAGEYVVIQILSGTVEPKLNGKVVTWGRNPSPGQFALSLGPAILKHNATMTIADGGLSIANAYMEADGLGIRTTAKGRLLTVSVPRNGSDRMRIEIPN